MKVLRAILTCQAIYYLATGIWPLLHIASFMAVTGPKEDIWLVKMVGLLAAAIGLALMAGRNNILRQTVILSIGAALAFISIDLYYSITGVIYKIYLADAAIQTLLITGILIFWLKK